MINSTLIYNPAAGTHQGRREGQILRAAEVLRRSGFELTVSKTSGPGSAQELARHALAEGRDPILVCGGDGTIGDVVNAMAQSPASLGILPGGTANIAAKELGLPNDPVRAAKQVLKWRPKRIALGRAAWMQADGNQERYFLSVAGAGFDAHVIRQLSLAAKAELGVMAYIMESVRQVFRYSYPSFTCRTQENEIEATFAVAQRSRQYAGWIHLAPKMSFLKRGLTCTLFRGRGPGRYLAYAAAVLLRRQTSLPDVTQVESTKILCSPKEPDSVIYFELDGERTGRLPVTFDSVPEALTLLGPWSSVKAQETR